MKANKSKQSWCLALLAFWLAGVVSAHAQGRAGGGGGGFGGGGFGGGGFGGGRNGATTSSSTSATTVNYPNKTLPGNATFSIDPETHSLIVMTDDSTADQISNVVANLDRPKPQVLIKVVFLEVQHDDSLDLGVEGSFNKNVSPGVFGTAPGAGVLTSNIFGLTQGQAGPGTPQTIGQITPPFGAGLYSVLGSDFTATVRAIASAQKVEVLSRPSIMVRNNQPATITVGQSVPLVTGVTQATANSAAINNITYQNVGVILQVTPFISSDGLVEMIVAPQISSLSSTTVPISTNENVPVIDLRSASTVVVTPDGQTVIIGGLMENDKTVINSKIPLLGDIPLLGALFRHKQDAFTKKELLIFLTPHVVNMPTQVASATIREDKNATLSHKAFDEKELDQFFDRLPARTNSVTGISNPSGTSNPNSPSKK